MITAKTPKIKRTECLATQLWPLFGTIFLRTGVLRTFVFQTFVLRISKSGSLKSESDSLKSMFLLVNGRPALADVLEFNFRIGLKWKRFLNPIYWMSGACLNVDPLSHTNLLTFNKALRWAINKHDFKVNIIIWRSLIQL